MESIKNVTATRTMPVGTATFRVLEKKKTAFCRRHKTKSQRHFSFSLPEGMDALIDYL